jgi:hypothetical protein
MYKLLFLLHIIIGQWIFWLIILMGGRFHIWSFLFVAYPHNSQEYQHVIPDWGWLRKYMSGRPIPAGIVPGPNGKFGIKLYVSNQMKSFRKKKNRHIAKKIEMRMRRALRVSRAKSVGFAGQLGIIMEKRHDIPMVDPFYASTQGNIYSLLSAIDYVKRLKKHEDSDRKRG